MPRKPPPSHTHNGEGVRQYQRLENRLVLLAWLNSLFGYKSNRELLEDCRAVGEGYGSDGHSFLYHHLIARGERVLIAPQDLARYDDNIRSHLAKLNRKRISKITLRYFQHLAALYAEIFLDRFFNHREQLLADLNAFVEKRNANRHFSEPLETSFSDADLDKLAFWMATGSGKTLLLHLNYYQYLHYIEQTRAPFPDNIVLVTPNEGLSEQHLAELEASDIPAQRFDLERTLFSARHSRTVQVIEITKLVESKQGRGESVPIEAFEGRNLVFVDEGHKGSGGEAWRRYRDALGKNGFTFEYSATFGQALSAARNDPLTEEYGKAIAFDYSYRYFYGDGFGKDFRVLNLRDEAHGEQVDRLLLGNLLSFYEQVFVYKTRSDSLAAYNLEQPLWVFVGSTVNAVYTEHHQLRSDVLTVARFFHRVLREREWAKRGIEDILNGKSGLSAPDGSDLFLGRFPALRAAKLEAEAIYDDLLRSVFHAPSAGGLHLIEIKRAPGEIGLRAAGADKYFGVIYIGDVSAFKDLLQRGSTGIVLEQDAIGDSLFARINERESPIYVLIGARKFIEGWNSWRVSSMGLLNIGRNEGAQIIQLFGRGVRLKGMNWSLKRSSALNGEHPQHIHLLETLNIFAVRANYMAQFRDYLEREGLEVESPIELPLFIKVQRDFFGRGLVVPRPDPNADFIREASFMLEVDSGIQAELDLSVRVQTIQSTATGMHTTQVRTGQSQSLPSESLDLVDWDRVYLDVLAYKQQRGMTNLIVTPTVLRTIASQLTCTIFADPHVVRPQSLQDQVQLQQAVARLLCVYVEKFYRVRREAWETNHALVYQPLDESDPNVSFNPRTSLRETRPSYVLRIPRSESELVRQIKNLRKQIFRLYRRETYELPRLHFARHLYVPLLLKHDKIEMNPPGLNQGEEQFVRDLRAYWEQHCKGKLAGKELFLLRNLSRGKGIGFFEERGFYPDFILWLLDQNNLAQRIIFVEPHGMLYAKAYQHDEKARLWEKLQKVAQAIAQRTKQKLPQNSQLANAAISLDSYIISATPFDKLKRFYDDGSWDRKKFANHHILFPERDQGYDYIDILLT